ncbi:MAG: HDOD domain-containing protein [Acidobacteriia bacterium]|nr:HDOD domain-containing protein [Terriglobia bacterium]
MLAVDHFRSAALRAANDLPMLSAALQRALSLLAQGDDVSVAQLAGAVEQDVVIASSILSVANSVMYTRTGKVASVRLAIARLGIPKTRNMLLGLSVTRAFRKVHVTGGWSYTRFNAHSLATAILADLLARSVPAFYPEWAFMAGLMHEAGLLLIASAFPQQFKAILAEAASDFDLVRHEKSVFGFSHFELGSELLGRWNFPPPVQHATTFCQSNTFEFTEPLTLGAVVKCASLLADSHKISIFDWNHEHTITEELLEALQVSRPADFLAEFESGYQELHITAV